MAKFFTPSEDHPITGFSLDPRKDKYKGAPRNIDACLKGIVRKFVPRKYIAKHTFDYYGRLSLITRSAKAKTTLSFSSSVREYNGFFEN